MHRCRSAANGKLLFGICPKTHEGPREGDPQASRCGDSETRRSFAAQ